MIEGVVGPHRGSPDIESIRKGFREEMKWKLSLGGVGITHVIW